MFIVNYSLRSAARSLLSNLNEILTYADYHPYVKLKKRALEETADYISAHMPEATSSYGSREIMDLALEHSKPDGHYMEFGVYKGSSIRYIAKKVQKKISGFDSFEGLGADWTGTLMKKDDFNLSKSLPKVPNNVELYPGWFKDSLPKWVESNQGLVSFLHIDCDLYNSTKTIFDILGPRIGAGTVILFDEYFNYPNWKNHEFKAFQEYVSAQKITYKYLAYSYFQVAVIIL